MLIEIIIKQLLLQLIGYLCYWQMGFNSVFKGLIVALDGELHASATLLLVNQSLVCIEQGVAGT